MSSIGTDIPFALHVPLQDLPAADPASETTPVQLAALRAHGLQYDIVCVPLTTDAWRTRWQEMCIAPTTNGDPTLPLPEHAQDQRSEQWRAGAGFRRDEVTVTRPVESEYAIAMASDWLELDSPEEGVRLDSEVALKQEIAYAAYLGFSTLVLPPPRYREHTADYARAINAAFAAAGQPSNIQISVRIPIFDPAALRPSASAASSFVNITAPGPPTLQTVHGLPAGDLSATWEMWDVIRTALRMAHRCQSCCLCLVVTALDLTPPLPVTMNILARWTAEPARHIFIPALAFVPNARGYPVLTKATQSFLRDIMKHRPTVILSNTAAGTHSSGGEGAYSEYIRHLARTSPALLAMETEGTVDNFAKGYYDYLQAPLQPLMDNLHSMTYESFEKDPVKYYQYEEAVFRALSDRSEEVRQQVDVICVAGAGRGPIVARCLKAIERSGRTAIVYAVEKNVNAFVTLQQRSAEEWGTRVRIVFGDMRSVELPETVDILVSELLGSFGDNELSPECIDGAQRFLKPDGISIPASYTAHLAPLSSSRLHQEVHNGSDSTKAAETPYVVMFGSANIMSGDGGGVRGKCGGRIQECWEFEHPRRDLSLDPRGLPWGNTHNTRATTLNFHIPHAGVLHGFGGWFEAVLYADVGLSIHPDRMHHISPNMISWFPFFIPLRDPLYVPADAELQVSLWRLTDKRRVWYEWFTETFLPRSATASASSLPNAFTPGGLMSPTPQSAYPAPSPLLDAPANAAAWFADRSATSTPQPMTGYPHPRLSIDGEEMETRIKVGQTALHNPSGRSWWIGL
ncbi:PRMT5-domain-containing protein [Auriculariales sp. MPI-PUGE-AT-0066]|nr:PRMT5-domain-containing protein [Auriculariales sp. MPI-PUGE-AT-0066]